MHPTVERFQERLRELGASGEARELPNSSHTATEAAEALGTAVGQIVKSLVFLAGEKPIMVLASGENQVDTDKVAALVGEPVGRAGAKTVREATGYAIGGVPPVAHATELRILVDRDLLAHAELWAAAGTPNAVFPTNPDELIAITGGEWADIRHEF
ncbi:YbaK/EbsC family protein [Frankia sp. CNm7]|uniref:YbaK/EbsC family protein n=1 Tax=Frankia nepalensis TaxID=1836974 RepID=A0A937UU66_9ACTN|nr:YbaK/EbsC family protein [Frankia nepalensis]MBL7499576.1 YbaK/EbsC family protein [Frankia nepalensis]MBL7513065.1 YbaK/EbsC family protein [Frankia nepalensis]MBL7522901.1 YbaK/EbsC family protein [Frankia nepalensis]MBL7633778.1 YbaK/EbsC family protein [Frankia nepalensis]